MKGFMHVVEIILVILLVFVVFTQFSSIPRISTEWSDVKLKLIGNDLISSLEIQGVDWFGESELEDKFNRTLPKNIIYNLRLENVIKPKIRIGCLCSSEEFDELVLALSPGWFVINEENVTFEIIKVDDLEEIFNLDFDVSLFLNYANLEAHEIPLKNFLSYDKGIAEICDIGERDSVQEEVFGLKFSALTPNSNKIVFSDYSKVVGKEVYILRKYFYHIPIFYESFDNLDQWVTKSGSPVIVDFGYGNNVNLQTGAPDTWICSNSNDFSEGGINLDVYIESGGIFFLNFRFDQLTEDSYVAALSTDPSLGYDAFYTHSADHVLTYIGSDQSHTTTPNEWHRMKIVVDGGNFELYNDGEFVASASDSAFSRGAICMYHQVGEVYADNVRTTFKKNYEFQNFLNSSENVTQLDDDMEKVLLVQDSGLPAGIINYRIQEGNGRTVWLSGGGNTSTEEQRTLIKSVIAWAAGNKYDILKGDIKRPVIIPLYKTFNRDMLQEVRVVLNLGYLY